MIMKYNIRRKKKGVTATDCTISWASVDTDRYTRKEGNEEATYTA